MDKVPQFKPYWIPVAKPIIRQRESSTKRGYDRHWGRCRKAYLAAHPMCQEKGCNQFAVEVDHIVSMSKGGAKYDWKNLCGYCKRHHTQKTNREDGGFGRQRTSNS